MQYTILNGSLNDIISHSYRIVDALTVATIPCIGRWWGFDVIIVQCSVALLFLCGNKSCVMTIVSIPKFGTGLPTTSSSGPDSLQTLTEAWRWADLTSKLETQSLDAIGALWLCVQCPNQARDVYFSVPLIFHEDCFLLSLREVVVSTKVKEVKEINLTFMVCYSFLCIVKVTSLWVYFIEFRRLWFYLQMEISLPPPTPAFFCFSVTYGSKICFLE